MNTKTNLLREKKIVFLIVAMFACAIFVHADESISTLSDTSSSDTQDKVNELQKRADIYREIIDIKKKQSATLSDQLSITDSNIAQVQAQIDASKQKIDDLNSQISRIQSQIKEKEALMESQKKILAGLMQSYYEVNLASPVISYLTDGNVASFIVKKDRIGQTGDKIGDLVEAVKQIKSDLESQSAELDQKKGDVVATNQNLNEQNGQLVSVKSQKENLLAQTKGEEAKYQQLLARVESQKAELLDIDSFASSNFTLEDLSIADYLKKHQPSSSSFASTDWYFSQKNPKWANENIGNTKTLMGSYGCAVTSVAMVFKEHGGSMDPGDLANQSIFSGDLINWPSAWNDPKMSLISGKSHGNLSWSTVDEQLAKGNPVIVYIGKTKGSGGHYVVIHHKEASTGKYVVHDPYFGANIYLTSSQALVGAMGVDSGTKIDQMIIYN